MKRREVNEIEIQFGPSGFWPWVLDLLRWLGIGIAAVVAFWALCIIALGILARMLR